MKLIIFDIDGTLLDSVGIDDACFIQSFKELFNINLEGIDWNNFKHVTDHGLTIEIFEKYKNRKPFKNELEQSKKHFSCLIEKHVDKIVEIENAYNFVHRLSLDRDFVVAFATGGWKETALLKCQTIGLDLNSYLFRSSNDHYDRGEIMKLVIEDASKKYHTKFESIYYFGDGLWDLRTTNQLGINFIGVDVKGNNKLKNVGAELIIDNFMEISKILSWIS